MCSWTLPCVSSLVPSVLHLSHGFQCSPTLNRQPYEGRLPLTSWLRKSSIQPDILSPPLLLLTSWKPLWLDMQPVDIRSRWRHNWKSAHSPSVRPHNPATGFRPPWQQWSLLNRFHTEQGHCSACRKKWRLTDTDLCPCGEIQMMSHIVESCPVTKLYGGLSRLHSADEDAVLWLTSDGSWHAYKKKKIVNIALSATILELFDVEWYHDLEIFVRGHSRSFRPVPFKSLGAVSHLPSIVTMALSVIVCEIEQDICWKLIFHIPLHLMPPFRGFPWECCHLVWYGKPRMVGLPDGKKTLRIRAIV